MGPGPWTGQCGERVGEVWWHTIVRVKAAEEDCFEYVTHLFGLNRRASKAAAFSLITSCVVVENKDPNGWS